MKYLNPTPVSDEEKFVEFDLTALVTGTFIDTNLDEDGVRYVRYFYVLSLIHRVRAQTELAEILLQVRGDVTLAPIIKKTFIICRLLLTAVWKLRVIRSTSREEGGGKATKISF